MRECPCTGNADVSQSQFTQTFSALQRQPSGPTPLPATNPNLSQKITAETALSVELCQILMGKAYQDNKLFKK